MNTTSYIEAYGYIEEAMCDIDKQAINLIYTDYEYYPIEQCWLTDDQLDIQLHLNSIH